jgi:hypothetical protein
MYNGKRGTLWIEGARHVAREVGLAQGEEARGVVDRMLKALKGAKRPQEYAEGVRDACKTVIKALDAQAVEIG